MRACGSRTTASGHARLQSNSRSASDAQAQGDQRDQGGLRFPSGAPMTDYARRTSRLKTVPIAQRPQQVRPLPGSPIRPAAIRASPPSGIAPDILPRGTSALCPAAGEGAGRRGVVAMSAGTSSRSLGPPALRAHPPRRHHPPGTQRRAAITTSKARGIRGTSESRPGGGRYVRHGGGDRP